MKYLIDTCVLLWVLTDDIQKLDKFKEIFIDPKNFIFVSMASYWEISIKRGMGKIRFEGNLYDSIQESGFKWINIEIRHVDYLVKLPLTHSDPFDRLIIAQSLTDNLKILTSDRKVLQYL